MLFVCFCLSNISCFFGIDSFLPKVWNIGVVCLDLILARSRPDDLSRDDAVTQFRVYGALDFKITEYILGGTAEQAYQYTGVTEDDRGWSLWKLQDQILGRELWLELTSTILHMLAEDPIRRPSIDVVYETLAALK